MRPLVQKGLAVLPPTAESLQQHLCRAEHALALTSSSSARRLVNKMLGSTFRNDTVLSSLFQSRDFMRHFFYTPTLRPFNVPSLSWLRLGNRFTSTLSPTAQAPLKPKLKLEQDWRLDLPAVLGTDDLSFMTGNIRKLIQSEHPLLTSLANYYFSAEGKKLRPLLVLLMAAATRPLKSSSEGALGDDVTVTKDANTSEGNQLSAPHVKLAMITELIHTASLLHDDVIDEATVRRNQPAVQHRYGNKLAILGGDFLLSRASVALASLGNTQVVSLLAQVLGDLVQGEVMQMRGQKENLSDLRRHWQTESAWQSIDEPVHPWLADQWVVYLQKTYLKTASLMAKSCRASVVLHQGIAAAGDSNRMKRLEEMAYTYGKHVGMTFQLTDDVLDYAESEEHIGKPSEGSDLKLGLATGPVLYACQEDPELIPILQERLGSAVTSEENVQTLIERVRKSQGIERTRVLARWHSQKAVDALAVLPAGSVKEVLEGIALSLVHRNK